MERQDSHHQHDHTLNTVGHNITFYQHIKPLFTQWDQVQMLYNVQVGGKFDLWDYAQVRNKAAAILSRLTLAPSELPGALYSGMPKYIGPWSEQDISLFQTWMDNGYLEGVPPKRPDIPEYSELPAFIALSELLTGFDNLPAVMTQINAPDDLPATYLYRLIKGVPGENISDRAVRVKDVLQRYESIQKLSGLKPVLDEMFFEPFRDLAFDEFVFDSFRDIAQDIQTLWYGSYLVDRQTMQPYYGTPEFNQYIYGLVWLNGGAHPMGHATYADNTEVNPPLSPHTNTNDHFYWSDKPSDPNPETGLFSKNTGY